jgi:phosphatidylserine decarboxylase
MDPIVYLDRIKKEYHIERVYGSGAIKFLYGDDLISEIFGAPLLHLLIRNPIFSTFYGAWQKSPWSKKKIKSFIEAYHVDPSEFAESIDAFQSFNDFFTRKLKPEARPIASGNHCAIIPADARYRFYPNIAEHPGFIVKGEKFDLDVLLEDKKLAEEYAQGTMVIARLCPSDYHRFHFPCDCIPGQTKYINGWLYSVNPAALTKDIHIFSKNKRTLCKLDTVAFGQVLFLEIGATNVGSIHQTYTPGKFYHKGTEKGYFSFGASSIIMLFKPNKIVLDEDLFTASKKKFEILCLFGQSLGLSPDSPQSH